MQLPNAPDEVQFQAISAAMHDARIGRYLPAAGRDLEGAFRLYLWNCALCEAFYLPLHMAEIVCRNAIHKALIHRCGDAWYQNPQFTRILSDRYFRELEDAVEDERSQHGVLMTNHHVVSALTFGFWQHLVTRRFERLLWHRGMRHSFPNLRLGAGRNDIYERMEAIRRWRNRIAHHRAIFDKGPSKKHQDTLELIRWVCADVAAWVTAASQVSAAIDLRPAQPTNAA